MMILVAGIGATSLLAPAAAWANDESKYGEVLAMSPGATVEELRGDISRIAAESGRSSEEVLDEMVIGARAAASGETTATANGTDIHSLASSGDDGLGYVVKSGCSTTGNFTYSHARNYGQNHGHNAIYYSSCGLVHAPGPNKTVARVSSTYSVYSHPDYVAHIRSPKNVTSTQRSQAGSFANSKVGLPYNLKFYANRVVNSTSYNCSQLVWAAWRSAANIDLSGHSRTGIYPDDLRKSPAASYVKNMGRA